MWHRWRYRALYDMGYLYDQSAGIGCKSMSSGILLATNSLF